MIRVLVADDSPTARLLLVDLLRADPEIEVVGEATHGEEALALVHALRPDLVTMDIQMPRLDGFQTTRRIMAEAPTPIVVVSSLDVRDVRFSLEALRAGALAVLPRPSGPGAPTHAEDARRLVATVKGMAQVKLVRRPGQHLPTTTPLAAPPPATHAGRPLRGVRAVGIAASTGGPAALRTVLGALPADFPAPILVVQHIAIGFAEGLARWLDEACRVHVALASDGERLRPGRVYLSPNDFHLGVGAAGHLRLSSEPPIDGFRPSGDHLFRSLGEALGPAALAVVLTGMGRDGTEGARALRAAGGAVVAQDEASSDVFGMPAAVIEAGLADRIVPLGSVAALLKEAVGAVG
ncbi:MAG: chemotaxis-specific protein-glutamate methyltransferase CheB [Planctomycetes bacterium]|nr:chemotaxis-specific protein-glutamate methyltransferase CheB [Planctomycetota bacterium]